MDINNSNFIELSKGSLKRKNFDPTSRSNWKKAKSSPTEEVESIFESDDDKPITFFKFPNKR